jgi:hypothetical protein
MKIQAVMPVVVVLLLLPCVLPCCCWWCFLVDIRFASAIRIVDASLLSCVRASWLALAIYQFMMLCGV